MAIGPQHMDAPSINGACSGTTVFLEGGTRTGHRILALRDVDNRMPLAHQLDDITSRSKLPDTQATQYRVNLDKRYLTPLCWNSGATILPLCHDVLQPCVIPIQIFRPAIGRVPASPHPVRHRILILSVLVRVVLLVRCLLRYVLTKGYFIKIPIADSDSGGNGFVLLHIYKICLNLIASLLQFINKYHNQS
jgi:hypothetical protein